MRRTRARPPGVVARTGPDHRSRRARAATPFGAATLAILALLSGAWGTSGCASAPRPSVDYASVLHGPVEPRDVAALVRAPSAHCVQQFQRATEGGSELVGAPLPTELRSRASAALRGLHPVALQVVRRLDSVWFARDIVGAEARFVPCEGEDGGSGLIVLDANTSLPDHVRDFDVPRLYWQLLGAGDGPSEPVGPLPHATRHGLRYVLLHELGHALSLFTGEFELSPTARFEVGEGGRFVEYSWGARTSERIAGTANEARSFVPTRLAWSDWSRLRRALEPGPSWLAPGYRPIGRAQARTGLCSLVEELPRAGFVTPTAAMAPTEDYAELFAHAILAAEGSIAADDRVAVTLEGCAPEWIVPPYFAPGVSTKRAYLERWLELGPAGHRSGGSSGRAASTAPEPPHGNR